MMKKFSLISLMISLLAAWNVESVNNQPQTSKYPRFVQEPDQTDIYAIPLDEDADEQQQELEELEHPEDDY